ncbi:MAG: hypothetical protein U0263_23815 [Polyangiaceae bacterium]
MIPNDPRLKMARYLHRIAFLTRGLAILSLLGGVVLLFAALDMRSSSDRVGFSLMSLALMVISILVWSTGVFHGAFASALPLLHSIDDKLDALGSKSTAVPEPAPVAPATLATATPELAASPEPEPEARAARVREPEPEPERVPCPHCAGLVHPGATRCVHCMKKIRR